MKVNDLFVTFRSLIDAGHGDAEIAVSDYALDEFDPIWQVVQPLIVMDDTLIPWVVWEPGGFKCVILRRGDHLNPHYDKDTIQGPAALGLVV